MVVVTSSLMAVSFLDRVVVVCRQEGCGDVMVETCE